LNSGPPVPQTGALTGLRYAPNAANYSDAGLTAQPFVGADRNCRLPQPSARPCSAILKKLTLLRKPSLKYAASVYLLMNRHTRRLRGLSSASNAARLAATLLKQADDDPKRRRVARRENAPP
jgi:hypothetical protein